MVRYFFGILTMNTPFILNLCIRKAKMSFFIDSKSECKSNGVKKHKNRNLLKKSFANNTRNDLAYWLFSNSLSISTLRPKHSTYDNNSKNRNWRQMNYDRELRREKASFGYHVHRTHFFTFSMNDEYLLEHL